MAKPEESAPLSLTQDQFSQLLAAVKQTGDSDHTARLEKILLHTAEVSAQAMQKALKPENNAHTGVSAFSYPEGDVAHPRPKLPYELFLNGYPAHTETDSLHWYELELFSKLQPGEYYVSRSDMADQKVSILGTRDANGKLIKLEWQTENNREERKLAAPLAVQAYQILHQDRPRNVTYIEGTTQYMHYVVMKLSPSPETVSA